MASEEAKTKWLRMANRCIVDEDYVRESWPFSFIPSSSKSESETSSYDLPADTRWWLNQQNEVNVRSFCNPRQETSADYVGVHELKDVIGNTLQKKTKLPESWTEEDELVAFSDEPEKLFSGLESQWIGVTKNAPWWRATDLDDLASFVSHKSLQHFDNCDLPLPKTNKTGLLVASSPQEPDKDNSSFSSITGSLTSQYTSGIVGCSPETPFSTKQANNTETPNSELSNAQLLEALSHSQRRAREAERAAQQAYKEKENVISLFLKQASQMFAYKQWLYILQLEALCLKVRRRKYQPIYTRFPDFVTWSYTKGKLPKRVHKAPKRYKMHRSVGNFLWGLALVGAGVLLGWTLGWLFPATRSAIVAKLVYL